MNRAIIFLALVGCGRGKAESCACPMAAHGAVDDADRCLCLPLLPATEDPLEVTRFELASNETPDWAAIDESLADGPVRVVFDPEGVWDERILVERTDMSDNRLVLDGGGGDARATVPGITTGFEEVVV